MNNIMPFVVERTANGERSYDLTSRLMKDRIVILNGTVEPNSCNILVQQLLFLESEDPNKPIHFHINSPGGYVIDGLSVYDTMQFISCPVYTYVMGQAASMGSLLAQSGAPGHRYMMPNARHMIHQVSAGAQGTAMDMNISINETLRLNKLLTSTYVKHNSKGKTYEELERDMSRDKFMDPQTSLEYGLIDKIVSYRRDV